MKLTSKQIELMLYRSSKVDRLKNSMEMNSRYYRILYFYQKRKEEERINYKKTPFKHSLESDFNKIILSHNTSTWEKINKRTERHVLKMIKNK